MKKEVEYEGDKKKFNSTKDIHSGTKHDENQMNDERCTDQHPRHGEQRNLRKKNNKTISKERVEKGQLNKHK